MTIYIGDLHGKMNKYLEIVRNKNEEETICVGDVGIGFVEFPLLDPIKNKFIHGNHDNYQLCKQIPSFLGRYGVYKDVFFVSGAWSIDKEWRTPGVSWWADEELSYEEMEKAIKLYVEVKPKIVVSHDCPHIVKNQVLVQVGSDFFNKTLTDQGLQVMFEAWQPELWVFGHFHTSYDAFHNGCRFKCLNELETFKI